jgi:hypothetical protein
MSAPLLVKYSAANFDGLQESDNTSKEYFVYQIAKAIASETSQTGYLTIGLNKTTGVSIGNFVDTYRPDIVGTHPVTTTPSKVTYKFSQNIPSSDLNTDDAVMPLEWSTVVINEGTGETTTGIRPMTDTNIRTEVFDRVCLLLAAKGLGSYVLSPEEPVSDAGDTWVKAITITDTLRTGNNETYIWRKTAASAPAVRRALKLIPDSSDIREMSDTDMRSQFNPFVNYCRSTNRGRYALQEKAPSGTGQTWVKMGVSFSDNILKMKDTAYTGTYRGIYTSAVTKNYTGAYVGSYSGPISKDFNRNYRRTYGTSNSNDYYHRPVTKYFNRNYGGTRYYTKTLYFDGSYHRTAEKTYSGQTVTSTIDKISTVNLWLRTK